MATEEQKGSYEPPPLSPAGSGKKSQEANGSSRNGHPPPNGHSLFAGLQEKSSPRSPVRGSSSYSSSHDEHETPVQSNRLMDNNSPANANKGGGGGSAELPVAPSLTQERPSTATTTGPAAAAASSPRTSPSQTGGGGRAAAVASSRDSGAPVTDKLLGLLQQRKASSSEGGEGGPSGSPPPPPVAAVRSKSDRAEPSEPVAPPPSPTQRPKRSKSETVSAGMFSMGSWWGGGSKSSGGTRTAQKEEEQGPNEAAEADETSPEEKAPAEAEEPVTPPTDDWTTPAQPGSKADAVPKRQLSAADEEVEKEEAASEEDAKPAAAEEDSKPAEAESAEGDAEPSVGTSEADLKKVSTEEEETAVPKKEMNEEDKRHLEEAFQAGAAATSSSRPALRRGSVMGRSHLFCRTPVPAAATALRLLRKFWRKTAPLISSDYGGTKSKSFLRYLFGSSKSTAATEEASTFTLYRELVELLAAADADHSEATEDASIGTAHEEESDAECQERADAAVATFVNLFSVWGHTSSAFQEKNDRKSQQAFSVLQHAILDAATNLVAYGCLDGVWMGLAEGDPNDEAHVETHRASEMLAQSVFNSDLTLEHIELTAMKFLLTTGCRVTDDSLLRGSYLLQSIRTLYHVYLTTESNSNKVTARAALQQLVTSVFAKVVQTDVEEPVDIHSFPSENHRDAFLVLRSICKLSMRTLPDKDAPLQSHIGLQASASNDTWDGDKLQSMSERGERAIGDDGSLPPVPEKAHLVYTSAIHPALESKLLALELLLYVLDHTNFSESGFIQHCGPQFHAAIRNYLCVSLLKNCTSDNTEVVSLSLSIFVPVVRHFRIVLKKEIEAFVTNVFFVILDSKNSPAEHKSLVVNTFNEICSDPNTLAEIFLNYDCDLSAVDLFHRIVNTLSRQSRTGLHEPVKSGMTSFMGGPSEAQMEKFRTESRELRLDAMRALRQILASLHASIVEPMEQRSVASEKKKGDEASSGTENGGKQNLVEIYGSKKKRRAEESEAVLRFNQKPSAGIAYAAKCKHIDADDPRDVASYLLKNKDVFEKTQIGEYLGREAEYQNGFSLKVLHEYVRLMDFTDLVFDDAIRFFLSGFRLPGEAQKIDRIMEKFAERFTEQNPDVFPSADVAFILSFSIIMLNTDLHNPAIKEERRMTKEGFIRNNRGICDGQDLPEELLTAIFDRIQANPISLKEDDEARERAGDSKRSSITGLPSALSPASFFKGHYGDIDRARETNFQKERDHIVRTTESLLKRRRHGAEHRPTPKSRKGKPSRNVSSRFVLSADSGLRDEYVSPMFEVTWGPALAAFSTAMESANGTMGALLSIASDEELELAAENAAETIEVCLTGFRFAIGTAGLCGNDTARDAYMLALSRFSQLGTGVLLEPRHIRCVQTMLSLAREDGELLGGSWEHVFKALSEINRFHQLFHLMARNDRAAAAAAERRQQRLEAMERRRQLLEERKAAAEDGESITSALDESIHSFTDEDSLAESDLFEDESDFELEEDMDAKAIDEANAREVYDAVSEGLIEAIYERSSSLSAPAVMDFVIQLCHVSRMEIAVGSSDKMDLMNVSYRQQHTLLNRASDATAGGDQFHHTQPNIYNLQKLVEVTHYNMASRPRLIFQDIWLTVADHLTETALHPNPAIAMIAVDSFRQLSIQYLKRDELEVFEFQKRFLKPLETVMARSKQSSTKELLLNCVDRLMHAVGTDARKSDVDVGSRRTGGLKSGWIPVLTILGLGGRDKDREIAKMSWKILSDEITLSVRDEGHPDVLLSEHFVETVNALLMVAGGPHEDLALQAIDQLVALADFLANDSVTPPSVRRRSTVTPASEASKEQTSKQELELWWPILLGLSRIVGDSRSELRTKGLDTLVGIVNSHFFPNEEASASGEELQTLQLIFRGVLTPMLEDAETSSADEPTPALPEDFEFFLDDPKKEKKEANEPIERAETWLETTFDSFMDACTGICLRSISAFKDATLIEEIFAILNSCLLSDSGALAVRGLRRLEQFVTSDLDPAVLSDDVWATVSHMLRRCLSVRGLPTKPASPPSNEADSRLEEERKQMEAEYDMAVQEFIAEDRILSARRYVGGNATMVAGQLLSSERFAIGLRWRLFLVAGLGRAILEWDRAASVLSPDKTKLEQPRTRPPDYRETAMYGRKWMNRFLLQLASMKEIVEASPDADSKNRYATGQKLVVDLTQGMLMSFVEKERAASKYRHSEVDDIIYIRSMALVTELLSGYASMDTDHLKQMAWISPVLLSSCIQSKNEEIRLMVQKLVGRASPAPSSPAPYPSPAKPTERAESPEEKESSCAKDDTEPVKEPEPEAPGNAEAKEESQGYEAGSSEPPTSSDPNRQTSSSSDAWNPLGWFGTSSSENSEQKAQNGETDSGFSTNEVKPAPTAPEKKDAVAEEEAEQTAHA